MSLPTKLRKGIMGGGGGGAIAPLPLLATLMIHMFEQILKLFWNI